MHRLRSMKINSILWKKTVDRIAGIGYYKRVERTRRFDMGRMSDLCIEIDELVGEAYETGATTPNSIVAYVNSYVSARPLPVSWIEDRARVLLGEDEPDLDDCPF